MTKKDSMDKKYVIGLDFGSLSVRAIIVDVNSGKEITSAVDEYDHAVMTDSLPSGTPLGVDWALQDAEDYIGSMCRAVKKGVESAEISKEDIIGIGVDFTSCTILPVLANGTPLSSLPKNKNEPHAYVKLWMHHAASAQAERINQTGARLAKKWFDNYSGKVSAEFAYPKILQIIEEAPEIFREADLILEAGDWIVWKMTGELHRNSCAAGYKALWHHDYGYPPKEFFATLNPLMENITEEKLAGEIYPIGERAGVLTEEFAGMMGLKKGTSVAVAIVDGHCAFASLGVDQPGTMMVIMGTSGCHLTISSKYCEVSGMCGVVKDGILPGFYGYEAGQAGFGVHLSWFIDNCVPVAYANEAEAQGISVHDLLVRKASLKNPGESGLIALDWWNGNRSVINNQDLSGVIVGLTLQTKPEDIYLALIESLAFGTRKIIESYSEAGIGTDRIVAVGGIPEKKSVADAGICRCFKQANLSGRIEAGNGAWRCGIRSSRCR